MIHLQIKTGILCLVSNFRHFLEGENELPHNTLRCWSLRITSTRGEFGCHTHHGKQQKIDCQSQENSQQSTIQNEGFRTSPIISWHAYHKRLKEMITLA